MGWFVCLCLSVPQPFKIYLTGCHENLHECSLHTWLQHRPIFPYEGPGEKGVFTKRVVCRLR